ncbi:acyltransferase family protein [Rhodococcoides fascians]|uniref:acyltransferase family protein n=1 Tax=Rhodococcoides fascians TaxID=1828 RepID=UPI00277E5F95|nr:acyltransferase [Rhodococcus fascians]MDQ0281337.1 exopolysaccharide production protein ExoZ [Rhodococcus fascians]
MTETGAKPVRPKQTLQGLQFVRANAVLLVVICHSAAVLGLPQYFNNTILDNKLQAGAVGVDIFFTLSGFIIVYVSLRTQSLNPRVTFADFAVKRFERIVPFLWIAVSIYAALRFLMAGEFDIAPTIRSLFLWPIGEVRPNVVWSLRHEMLFYAIFAVSFLLKKRCTYLLYAWCSAPILVALLHLLGITTPQNEWFIFTFNRANALFGCGTLVAFAYQRYSLNMTASRPWLGWAGLTAATCAAFFARDTDMTALVAIATTTTLIAGLIVPESPTLFARTWERLGDASYAIYLTHNIALLGGAGIWVRLLGTRHYPLAIPILATAAVIFGVAAHYWIERPVTNRVRKVVGNIRHNKHSTNA